VHPVQRLHAKEHVRPKLHSVQNAFGCSVSDSENTADCGQSKCHARDITGPVTHRGAKRGASQGARCVGTPRPGDGYRRNHPRGMFTLYCGAEADLRERQAHRLQAVGEVIVANETRGYTCTQGVHLYTQRQSVSLSVFPLTPCLHGASLTHVEPRSGPPPSSTLLADGRFVVNVLESRPTAEY
jgi:hypothetical protein